MKILALDIATNTGWCTETSSGVWNQMIEAAKQYNPTVTSDDEADAIILYRLAITDLQIA